MVAATFLLKGCFCPYFSDYSNVGSWSGRVIRRRDLYDRLRCDPGLRFSPFLSFNFDGQFPRRGSVSTRENVFWPK